MPGSLRPCPDELQIARMRKAIGGELVPAMQAGVDAIRYVADETDLVPVGMCIGPFTLMTKLMGDPITAVFLAGMGMDDSDPDVKTVNVLLELCEAVAVRHVKALLDAGAQAIMMVEPAANVVYVSPKQVSEGSDVFERLALQPLRRIAELVRERGASFMFHCCGELTDDMVRGFGSLRPVLLSLGGSRDLTHDAGLIDADIVLYGNIASKTFYSDEGAAAVGGGDPVPRSVRCHGENQTSVYPGDRMRCAQCARVPRNHCREGHGGHAGRQAGDMPWRRPSQGLGGLMGEARGKSRSFGGLAVQAQPDEGDDQQGDQDDDDCCDDAGQWAFAGHECAVFQRAVEDVAAEGATVHVVCNRLAACGAGVKLHAPGQVVVEVLVLRIVAVVVDVLPLHWWMSCAVV